MNVPADNILIVQATFYTDIASEMLRGATAVLAAVNAKHTVVSVPGCLEIPAAIKFALRADEMRPSGRPTYDGFIALGCVIRGDTDHYEHVSTECMRGLSHMVNNHSIALGNGVLTVENFEQAWDRALVDKQDKGGGAAKAALDMIALKRQLSAP